MAPQLTINYGLLQLAIGRKEGLNLIVILVHVITVVGSHACKLAGLWVADVQKRGSKHQAGQQTPWNQELKSDYSFWRCFMWIRLLWHIRVSLFRLSCVAETFYNLPRLGNLYLLHCWASFGASAALTAPRTEKTYREVFAEPESVHFIIYCHLRAAGASTRQNTKLMSWTECFQAFFLHLFETKSGANTETIIKRHISI